MASQGLGEIRNIEAILGKPADLIEKSKPVLGSVTQCPVLTTISYNERTVELVAINHFSGSKEV